MTASELFKVGKLKEAIDAQIQEVKAHPADQSRRLFLFELLAFAGDLERAKKHIELLQYPEPELAAAVATYSRLLDGETARRNLFRNGVVPRFFAEQTEHTNLCLEAINRLRDNNPAEAMEVLRKAQHLLPPLKGTLNGKPFEALRDCDDLFAGILEVLGQDAYYWVPLEQIDQLTVSPPKTPRDLLWRPARLDMTDGASGEVFLPILYPFSHEHDNELVKLGRMTDWKVLENGPVLGQGIHIYLMGEEDISLLEWKELIMANEPAPGATPPTEGEAPAAPPS